MYHAFIRTAFLLYAAVLVAGAWPFEPTPLLGPLGSAARGLLANLAIEPGEQVFGTPADDMGLIADCLEIDGKAGFSAWRPLYRSDCPPTTRKVALHQHHRHHVRHGSFDGVLRRWKELPEQPGEMLRRFVAIGDFYCHSPLIEGPPRTHVRLDLRQTARHLKFGGITTRQ